MRTLAFALGVLLVASPAAAQFGRIKDVVKGAEKVRKLSDIRITTEEERQIGQDVSDRIVQKFGVYQDVEVTKYVALVGTVLAQASSKPDLAWEFVVLDTDGVNAFAAPGGFIHVTRGLLGLMENEAELAGVLAHEILHVAERHTINAIMKNDAVSFGSDEVSASGGMTQSLLTKVAEAIVTPTLDHQFSRGDENESDAEGVELANTVGYAPTGLIDALNKLAARNQGRGEPNGLFASHPIIKDRIQRITRTIRSKNLTATAVVAERYASRIAFESKPVSEIVLAGDGARGLAGGDEKPADNKDAAAKSETEPKTGGGLLSSLTGRGRQAKQTQTVASAGARGVNPDRDAVGGPNKARVRITLTPAEIEAFRNGIA